MQEPSFSQVVVNIKMFATTFSIDLLHQFVIIIIITYLKTWNFVKILIKLRPWPTFILCCDVNIVYNVLQIT